MQKIIGLLPNVLVGIIVLLLAAVFYWQVRELFTAPEETLPKTKNPVRITSEKPVKQHDISKFQLFGIAGRSPEPKPVETKDLPKTNLKLTLTGVSAGTGDRVASALIEGPNRETELYKVGDSLPGNATLSNIYEDRVVISRSGRLENLFFPRVSTGGAQYLAAVTPPDEDREMEAQPVPTPSAVGPSLAPGRKQSIKDRLQAIRKRIRSGQN